ncbi:MAG: type II toxin-antitoxin system PemK/MazF family toxin [Patescibacteria group bacterium]
MNKGDVWIIDAPHLGGHEQEGLRPAIVIADTQSSVAVVVPCTSNPKALRLPHTLSVKPSAENGLRTASVALILQIRAIDKKRLRKRIGALETSALTEINRMLQDLLAI